MSELFTTPENITKTKRMKLSHSKLDTIIKCPATYYLRYKQGIEPKVKKSALEIGSAVHWGIEHNTEDLSEYYRTEGTFKDRDNYTRDELLAESMVHGYLKNKDELFNQLLTDPKTNERLTLLDESHELFLSAKLPSTNEITSVEYLEFIGIIDLLLTTDKGFVLVDYKTSSSMPDWTKYLDQLYRYIYMLKCNFPDVPVVKIAIINLRKSTIRQKKTENDIEFLLRLKNEYENNENEYINYHEYLPEDIDEKLINSYIKNLSRMSDLAYMIDKTGMYYINYSNAVNMYGKSEYYDIFYQTPGAEALYNITDNVWDDDTEEFKTKRDCLAIDMLVLEKSNVLNKYEQFKRELLDTEKTDKDEFFDDLRTRYTTDDGLLELYWKTFIKEKSLKGGDS